MNERVHGKINSVIQFKQFSIENCHKFPRQTRFNVCIRSLAKKVCEGLISIIF
jgi:hypothetical protein